jgi:hypothetical protein
MAYCAVYGCNSDFKKAKSTGIHFFAFPNAKSADQQYRRKAWIEFCKRKAFKPTNCTKICSLHFAEDAYEQGNSPQFLQQIECKESFRVRLKKDALPTLSKPLALLGSSLDMKARSYSQRRQQKKVIILSSKSVSMHRLYSLFVSKTYL